jgi:hypothetical protein
MKERVIFAPKHSFSLLVWGIFYFCGTASAEYDLVLTGVNQFSGTVSYSNKLIYIPEDAFVQYETLVLDNCIVDVDGFLEIKTFLDMHNSVFFVYGSFRVKQGATIYKTGTSSIIITGDSVRSGHIFMKGGLYDPIVIESDYTSTEFIVIEEASSANSVLQFIDFFGGWCNIQIYNNRLNNAITNCRFIESDYPVYQESYDKITDVRFCFFFWNIISVYAQVNGAAQEEIAFKFDNLTIDNNFEPSSYGVVLSCLQNPAYIDLVGITNNIITNSYCGWYIGDGGFYPPIMSNLAYYGNYFDCNLADPNFQSNPMYLIENPFETPTDPNDWPYYVDPNSPVATAELRESILQSPQQMLTSIFSTPVPRGNFGIGYGVALPQNYYSEIAVEMRGDFDGNGIVDLGDFRVLSKDWLTEEGSVENPVNFPDPNGYSFADFDLDGIVDVNDLNLFAKNWLCTGARQIRLHVEDTPNRLVVTCKDPNLVDVDHFAIFLDEEHVATREPQDNAVFIIDKRNFKNGDHQLRAVVLGQDGNAYATVPVTYSFSTPLSNITYEKFPDPSKPFIIRGNIAEGNTAFLSIKDIDEQVQWSKDYTEDFVAIIDPNDIFGNNEVNLELTYSCVPTVLVELSQESPFDEVFEELINASSGSSSILALGGKPINAVAGLVICMLADGATQGANYTDTGTARFAWQTMKNKGIQVIALKGYGEYNQVDFDTFQHVFRKFTNVRYIHIYAHGNYECRDSRIWPWSKTPRAVLQFNDGIWPSYNSRKWIDRGLDVPEGYEYLRSDLEKQVPLCHLPFKTGQIRILVVESCLTQKMPVTPHANGLVEYHPYEYEYEVNNNLNFSFNYPHSDFTIAFKMTQSNQMILGSAEIVIRGSVYPYWLRGFNSFWEALGTGAKTAYDGITAFRSNCSNSSVERGYRIRGIPNLHSIRLTNLNN